MVAIFEKRILDGLGPIDEQAAIKPRLFLDDPLATAIFADKDDCGGRTARGRFDELHGKFPLLEQGLDIFPANIFFAEYEFEIGRAAIS